MDFVPGALVAGRYRLRRMVGSGGMGEVWAGDDAKSGNKVAVKHLLPAAAKHHEVVARFKREAYLLGRVESEYVARVVDFFDDETFGLVLVMEFIDGPSLAHILEQRVLSVEESIDLAVDLLRALSDLHRSKIVHRDLKPGNIIMRPLASGAQRATVVDFGISRLLPGKGENEVTGITRANIALGTVEYMAPEQILNSRDVTPVTDLYAVGIILYRAVKGHHAFGDRRGEELARAKLIEEAPGLDAGRDDEVAKGLVSIVARALKKKPSQRYASAGQMLAEVEELQRKVINSLDLDDSTTDSGETAIKPSPLLHQEDEPRTLAEAPLADRPSYAPKVQISQPAMRGAPPPQPGTAQLAAKAAAQAPPPPPRGSQAHSFGGGRGQTQRAPNVGPTNPSPPVAAPAPAAQPPAANKPPPSPPSPRASMPSISEPQAPRAAPSAPASGPSTNAAAEVAKESAGPRTSGADWQAEAAAAARIGAAAARASMPSISDAGRPAPSIPDREPPSPRASLASIPDFGARAELAAERGSSLSRGTVALAILTAFAVGAAVGLIVAPTNAPANKAADCPPCASNIAPTATGEATAASPDPLPPANTAPVATDVKDLPSASATAAASTAAVAPTSAKPVLTTKLYTAPKPTTAPTPTNDGLGEDPPPKPTGTSTSTGTATSKPTATATTKPTATTPPPVTTGPGEL